MNIKAIETVFDGNRFRSRLEARWATFFKILGMPYVYEKEGYYLKDGTRYLPDFWLPKLKLWVEIKGEITWHGEGWGRTSPELKKCEKFRDSQEWPVACVVGTPKEERIWFWGWDTTDSGGGTYHDDNSHWCYSNGVVTLDVNPGRADRSFYADNLAGESMPQFEWPYMCGCSIDPLTPGYLAARQARFERGK